MNDFLNKSFDHLQTAEHLYYRTYPVAKEPRLLLAVVKSISNSLNYITESILDKEKQLIATEAVKNINVLRSFAQKYSLSIEDISFMLRIQEILQSHEQSPVEFKRGNAHIICSGDYDLEVVSTKKVERYLQHTKKIFHHLKQR